MTRKQAEKFSIMDILTMKNIEMTMKSKEEKELPGTNMALEDHVIKTVKLKSGKDDAKDNLHDARFVLRPPLATPEEYWKRIPVQ